MATRPTGYWHRAIDALKLAKFLRSVSLAYLPAYPGVLTGLTLSNNTTDATNDIDFAAGTAADSTAARLMTLTAKTKQLDAAWAAGNNAGGRMSAAAITNTTYHCFVIMNPTTGAVDCGFDVSPTAPTLPTGYTLFRRVGSVLRISNALRAFTQKGDRFWLTTPITEATDIGAVADALIALTGIPTGLELRPILVATLATATAGTHEQSLGNAWQAAANVMLRTVLAGENAYGVFDQFTCNVSAQIRRAVNVTGGSITSAALVTRGWIDDRGRTA